ncbi:MAG TPA: metallophosphoesterase [Polyangiaceae bacterium]|nr:metallophosphoesterase [Polyangiaceae bacterium]
MSAARFLIFILLTLTVLGGLNLHVFRWIKKAWRLTSAAQRGFKLALWLSIAAMVLGRVAGGLIPRELAMAIVATGSSVQLFIIISAAFLLLADLFFGLGGLAGRLRARLQPAQPGATAIAAPPVTAAESSAPPPAPLPAELPRRAFLTQAVASSAFLIGGSSTLYGTLKGRHDYTLEELPFKLPGLPRALDGFTLAQLSDVHIGVYVGEPELRIAEDFLRRARPDLIVLTGDLLDNDPRLADQLGRFVRRLTPLARAGVVAISGNHDYFAGVTEVERAVTAAGARMLRNQGMVLGDARAGVALLGVDDVLGRRTGGGPDLDRALRSLKTSDALGLAAADMPRVLLCHNPSYFEESAGRVALQISGHTHGGQVNLGIRPADLLLPGGWVAGRYDLRGSALYVNRGFGTVGPPARIGSPPEVTRIVLTT